MLNNHFFRLDSLKQLEKAVKDLVKTNIFVLDE